MGIVFLARDAGLDRPVAVKLLPPYLAAQPMIRERFLQEARLVARLSHPNIVTVFDVGTRDGHPFLVTELLNAGDGLPASISEAVLGRLTRLPEPPVFETLATVPCRGDPARRS
jgi:serine/threonine-protein kinase